MKTVSYFRPDGSYRGSYRLFEPEDFGGKLHEDGISIIRPDGSVFLQKNPYAEKGLTELEGEHSGEVRLSNGKLVAAERVKIKSVDERLAEMESELAKLKAKA